MLLIQQSEYLVAKKKFKKTHILKNSICLLFNRLKNLCERCLSYTFRLRLLMFQKSNNNETESGIFTVLILNLPQL